MENLITQGGTSMANMNDRTGVCVDPEDSRHLIALIEWGTMNHYDGSLMLLSHGECPPKATASRHVQVLYGNYREPSSMNRVCAQLSSYLKVPNNYHKSVAASAEYMGQTASLIGHVVVDMLALAPRKA